jgi:hypothetical protein
MNRIYLLALAVLALALSACGGSGVLHGSSKQGDEGCRITSDVVKLGCPGVVRCVASSDGAPIIEWTFEKSGGTIIDQSADGSEIWLRMDKPGAYQLTARGVDANGNTCTTPRHKLTCAKGHNAEPVVVVDGGLDPYVETRFSDDGTDSWDVAGATWTAARSYDPEGTETFTSHTWTVTLHGPDGMPYVIASLDNGVFSGGDLDGDGVPDLTLSSPPGASPAMCVVQFDFHTVEHDPTVMYDLHYEATMSRGGRKGWDGCIYGNRPPGNK